MCYKIKWNIKYNQENTGDYILSKAYFVFTFRFLKLMF